ncbi:chemotaxis protein CheW [Duganella sp. FT134W]|uniref:Chemotaxis protein CheW n=1 Tax=Duganella margarita TaxID=2692170 RepID=A0A7X4GYX5_9BURK|nr:chemotaxis protein CheW [Duganella margarita]MYM72252.1 chemotaxis protein CheW [Duganella margarita]
MDSQAPTERRSRLRQYQVQLLERMQAAKSGAAVGGRALGVLLGGRACLLDLTQISEIVPLQAATPVPLTQEWYLGLTNIRGHLTGVIDLARYQGLAAGDSAPAERRLITFAPGLGFNCALQVERVLGLRKLAEMTQQEDSQQFLDSDRQQWTRIDLALLVQEPRFSHVGLI